MFSSLHSWRCWQSKRQGVWRYNWCTDTIGGRFKHAPVIWLFQWWSFFLVKSKTSSLGTTLLHESQIIGHWITEPLLNNSNGEVSIPAHCSNHITSLLPFVLPNALICRTRNDTTPHTKLPMTQLQLPTALNSLKANFPHHCCSLLVNKKQPNPHLSEGHHSMSAYNFLQTYETISTIAKQAFLVKLWITVGILMGMYFTTFLKTIFALSYFCYLLLTLIFYSHNSLEQTRKMCEIYDWGEVKCVDRHRRSMCNVHSLTSNKNPFKNWCVKMQCHNNRYITDRRKELYDIY